MKLTLSIDLRKAHPLGFDIVRGCNVAKADYKKARDMGMEDVCKPGWFEHRQERLRLLVSARILHGLIYSIAELVGKTVTAKVPELRWATQTDFNGNKKV